MILIVPNHTKTSASNVISINNKGAFGDNSFLVTNIINQNTSNNLKRTWNKKYGNYLCIKAVRNMILQSLVEKQNFKNSSWEGLWK